MAFSFERAVFEIADSVRFTCQEPMRSTDSGRDLQICGLKSETFCDECEMQLCPNHLHHCGNCGKEFCVGCYSGHTC